LIAPLAATLADRRYEPRPNPKESVMETVTIIGPAEFIKTVTDLAERYSERREVTQAAYEASPPYDPVEVVGPRFVL